MIPYLLHRIIDLPVLLNWANIKRGKNVLQLGCGDGKVSRYLSQKLHCKSYTAVDKDPRAIAKAEVTTHKDTKTIFQVADALNLPFSAASFDAVIEIDFLHRIPTWKKALKEVRRVLRPGGRFLMKDYSIETFVLPGIGMALQNLFDRPFDAMYDQIELITHIRKNGFEITHQNDNPVMIMLAATRKKI